MKKFKLIDLVLCALFAALSAILSQVIIPIEPVPIAMTHISIFLAAGLLGCKYGTISQVAFVALGAAGVPVFTGFFGGIGKIIGPTGGFIFGYIVCAFVVGLIIDRFGRKARVLVSSMLLGCVIIYFFGIIWYMHVTKTGFAAALWTCVIPFLPGDILKSLLSAALVNRLHPIIEKAK